MKNEKDLLKLGLIAVGAVFLFNPTINIIDFLPDFIGFWIIAYAMTAVSYLSERLYEARRKFVYLTFLEAVKLAVSLLIPGATGSFVVLMVFSFSVLEAVLFIPAVSGLFEGLSSMGIRYSSDSLFFVPASVSKQKKAARLEEKLIHENDEAKREKLQKKIGKYKKVHSQSFLKIFTVTAFLVRATGALIPTLPELMLYGDTLFVPLYEINRARFLVIFSYFLAVVIGLLVGIPWLVYFRRYWKSVGNDSSFQNQIYSKYAKEILSDKGRLYADTMKKVMLLLVCACILTFNFPVDHVNVTPNLLSAGLIFAALVYLMPWGKKRALTGMVSCFVWAVLSGIGVWLQSDYVSQNYDPSAAVAFEGEGRGMADELYFRMEIFSYVEAAFFLISALIVAWVFVSALNEHIKMMPPRRDGLERDAKKLKKCLKGVAISGGVVILFNFFLTFVTKWISSAWIINMAAVIVLSVFAIKAYFNLEDNVYLTLKRKF